MIRTMAFLFLLLGLGALALEQANPLLIYPYDATEEAPQRDLLPNAQVIELDGPEGKIVIWAQAPKPGKPVVFYLHGNAGNLADRTGRLQRLAKSGFGYFAPGYPGSSGSDGTPSEEALIASMRYAYDRLQSQFPGREAPVVIYGESLGSAVALGVVESFEATVPDALPRGVVLEAPFASISEMAQASVGDIGRIAPVFMDSWNSVERAAKMELPLLVIHGKRDRVVPIAQGQAVYDAAKSVKKRFIRVADANHVNLWSSGILTRVFGHMASKDLGL